MESKTGLTKCARQSKKNSSTRTGKGMKSEGYLTTILEQTECLFPFVGRMVCLEKKMEASLGD